MLAEKVVSGPAEVDLCMLLGANYPRHLGGLTPLLDQSGASWRVWGKDFHPGSGFADQLGALPARTTSAMLHAVLQPLPVRMHEHARL